jgi:hypothetical protein
MKIFQAEDLKHCVVVDFGAQWLTRGLKMEDVLEYRDLSKECNSAAAGQVLFEALRWAEDVPSAKFILLPDMFEKVIFGGGLPELFRLLQTASSFLCQTAPSLKTILPFQLSHPTSPRPSHIMRAHNCLRTAAPSSRKQNTLRQLEIEFSALLQGSCVPWAIQF